MDIHGLQTGTRIIDGDSILFFIDIHTDSRFLAFPEIGSEVVYPGMFDTQRWLCRESAKSDKGTTFYIVVYYRRLCIFSFDYRTINDHIMFMVDIYAYPERPHRIDEIQDVRLDRSKLDCRLSFSKCCHHEDILCRCNSETGTDSDIFLMIGSLEGDIFSFTHILITIACESIEVLIYRPLADVAPSRIRDLECAEACEERWKEKYTDADFFDFLSIEMFYVHLRSIIVDTMIFPCDSHSERLDNREKCHHITDLRDVMEREFLEKKPESKEWKSGIFGTRDFYCSRERLGSGDF